MRSLIRNGLCAAALALTGAACDDGGAEPAPLDPANSSFADQKADGVLQGTRDATHGVLFLASTATVAQLDRLLDRRAVAGIMNHRAGPDGYAGTDDDRMFLDLESLDAVPYFGPKAFERMVEHVRAEGLSGEAGAAAFLDARLAQLGGRAAFRLPTADDLDRIPADPKNPLTPSKVKLGKLLFHERGLAVNGKDPAREGTWSCASCHHAAAGFSSGNIQGFAEGGLGFGLRGEARRCDPAMADDVDTQPLKSPTALNVAYQRVMLWNGQFGATGPNAGTEAAWTEGTPKAKNHFGYEGVEIQALAGLAVHRMLDDDQPERSERAVVYEDATYQRLFAEAFPGQPIGQETAALAIAAYERTLVADQAPFQAWLRGDDPKALSPAALRGAALFFGEADCVACHTGPALSSEGFYRMGFGDLDEAAERWGLSETEVVMLEPNPDADKGRASFTGDDADLHAFKVPQLYNLADHAFFGHGGSFKSLREVVAYKAAAKSQNAEVPTIDLEPVELGAAEIDDLTAFLEEALYDPALDRYVPETLPSGLCGINGDATSVDDLGCE